MPPCQWEALADEWASGSLDSVATAWYEKHCRTCSACQAAAEQASQARDLFIFSASAAPPPRRPWTQLRRLLPLERRQVRTPWRPLLGAAAAALAIFAAWGVGRLNATPPAPPTAIALLSTAHGAADGRATLDASRLTINVHGLSPAPSGQVYEAWVYGPAGGRAVGPLNMTHRGGSLSVHVKGAGIRRVVICRADAAYASWQPGPIVLWGDLRDA